MKFRGGVSRLLPAIAWMVMIFGLSSRSTTPDTHVLSASIAAIVAHFVVYGVLAVLLALGLVPSHRELSAQVLVAGACLAVLYGFTDELHQSFVPGRDASVYDLLDDTIGAFFAVGIVLILTRRHIGRICE